MYIHIESMASLKASPFVSDTMTLKAAEACLRCACRSSFPIFIFVFRIQGYVSGSIPYLPVFSLILNWLYSVFAYN